MELYNAFEGKLDTKVLSKSSRNQRFWAPTFVHNKEKLLKPLQIIIMRKDLHHGFTKTLPTSCLYQAWLVAAPRRRVLMLQCEAKSLRTCCPQVQVHPKGHVTQEHCLGKQHNYIHSGNTFNKCCFHSKYSGRNQWGNGLSLPRCKLKILPASLLAPILALHI